jgi:hypothetical protein
LKTWIIILILYSEDTKREEKLMKKANKTIWFGGWLSILSILQLAGLI